MMHQEQTTYTIITIMVPWRKHDVHKSKKRGPARVLGLLTHISHLSCTCRLLVMWKPTCTETIKCVHHWYSKATLVCMNCPQFSICIKSWIITSLARACQAGFLLQNAIRAEAQCCRCIDVAKSLLPKATYYNARWRRSRKSRKVWRPSIWPNATLWLILLWK